MDESLLNLTYNEITDRYECNFYKNKRIESQIDIDNLNDYRFVFINKYNIKNFDDSKSIHFNKYCIGVNFDRLNLTDYNITFDEGVKYIRIFESNTNDVRKIIENLPSSVTYLDIVMIYCDNELERKMNLLDFDIPEHIKYLKLSGLEYECKILNNLPPTLEILETVNIYGDYTNLPANLQTLIVINNDSDDIDFLDNTDLESRIKLNLDCLPYGLKKLYVNNIEDDLPNLPPNLEELTLEYLNYNGDLTNLPQALKKLQINRYFKGKINIYPPNLKFLKLILNSDDEKKKFDLNQLPKTLKIVYLDGANFDYNLKHGLPPNIEEIYISRFVNVKTELLPSTLKKLHIYQRSEGRRCNCNSCLAIVRKITTITHNTTEIIIEEGIDY